MIFVRYYAQTARGEPQIRTFPVSCIGVINRLACGPSDCVWLVPNAEIWQQDTPARQRLAQQDRESAGSSPLPPEGRPDP